MAIMLKTQNKNQKAESAFVSKGFVNPLNFSYQRWWKDKEVSVRIYDSS